MDQENKPERQIDPAHVQKRNVLRIIGPVILCIGGLFMLVGLVSFFSAFGGDGRPEKFWCFFVGIPLLFVGIVLTQAGFIGAVQRYFAGEAAPVGKDTFNYMADGTKEGVKTIATAVGEGLSSVATFNRPAHVLCHKCNQPNDDGSKFCKSCGKSLEKSKHCPACNELNDPDARFCDNCGKAMTA